MLAISSSFCRRLINKASQKAAKTAALPIYCETYWATFPAPKLPKVTTTTVRLCSAFLTHPNRLPLAVFRRSKTTLATTTMSPTIVYPVARRDETVVDDFHGTRVADPYRWLEDPDAAETQAFVEAQNAISKPFLEQSVVRQQLNDKLTELWNYPKYSAPARRGNNYFHYANTGLQNQSVLYRQTSLDAEPTVFLDPNQLSADGTVALSNTSFSDDGQYFAYGLSESGSDWNKIKVRNVETGEDFPECLERIKFSGITWTKDNKGFFYSRFPEQDGKADGSETAPNENQKMYYHRIGESQDQDVMVVEFPDQPKFRISGHVSDCGKYLVLTTSKSCRDNLLYFADLEAAGEIRGKLDITQIVFELVADYEYVTNTGSLAVFRTNKDAPNYRLIVIDFNQPAADKWQTLIAEHELDVLEYVLCVHNDHLIIEYIHDVKSVLQVHSLQTGALIRQFPLGIGSVAGLSGDKKYSEIFFVFTSFLTPGTIYRYDFAQPNSEPTVFREIELRLAGFNRNAYQVDQVFYASKDGTKVPMFVIQKRRELADEQAEPRPCMLYGYGGFNISIQPTFSLTALMFVDSFDGVVAYPNIRGGGEYGERWHNGGRLLNKQNVFDDFQTAAEYLVENKYTTPQKIAIQGGSNGGLLVAACINQRPELFGAAVAQVGVMDMLRFHKFTIGHSWTSDYGSADEQEHFANLFGYSPLHNVKAPATAEQQYPSTLVLTADHDDRVSPLHSLKYVAALHEAVRNSEAQRNPLLLRVYNKAGHGAGKPTAKKIEEITDVLVFMFEALQVGTIKN